jgi:F-type H+-transporting ATPase subunit delta
MKITKQARREAKHLLQTCKVDGVLDGARVQQAVAAVAGQKPRGYLAMLSHFQRLVRLEIERRSARIESAIPLAAEVQQKLQASLAKRHGAGLEFAFAQNPALVGGLRVKVGSDVYDSSVRARLQALEEGLTN